MGNSHFGPFLLKSSHLVCNTMLLAIFATREVFVVDMKSQFKTIMPFISEDIVEIVQKHEGVLTIVNKTVWAISITSRFSKHSYQFLYNFTTVPVNSQTFYSH